MTDFEIVRATLEQKEVMENLMDLYLYDFSEFTGEDADAQGRFTDEYLPRYWTEPERHPFLIMVGSKYAGFVLVRQVSEPDESPVTYSMAEFFIMRKYRRQKLGQRVAWAIFDRFPGRWEVAQIPENLPAQAFWRRIIGEYTGGRYREVIHPELNEPMQVFETGSGGMPGDKPGGMPGGKPGGSMPAENQAK